MKNVAAVLVIVGVMMGWVISVPVWAQEKTAAEASKTEEHAVPDRKDLGPWWMYSAKKLDPVYPYWLLHIEANYNLTLKSGNKDGETHEGSANVAIRKNIVTNYLQASRSKTDLAMTGGDKTDTETISVGETVQVDLTSRFFTRAGVGWVRDTAKFIDSRTTYFGGLGVNILDRDTQTLSVRAYYGYDTLEFTDVAKLAALLAGVELQKESSDGILLEQSFQIILQQRISLEETFAYLKFFEGSDKYRWVLNLNAGAQVWGPLGVFASYKIDYNNSETLKILKGYEKKDTSFTMGFSITY